MEYFDELLSNIVSAVRFDNVASTGFNVIGECPCCGGKKTAGMLFENDKVVFNCFRGKCPVGVTAHTCGEGFSNKFKTLLDAIGVDIPFDSIRVKQRKKRHVDPELYEKHVYHEYQPDFEYKVVNFDNPVHRRFINYLKSRDVTSGEFWLSTHTKYRNRIIIPFYYWYAGQKLLIGIQAIDITGNYNPFIYGESLIYFPNGVLPPTPVIVEGVFDALSVPNGVAVLASSVTKKQAYIMRRCNPILLPDRSGSKFLDVARKYGWRMSLPKWKLKDANDAVKKYGKFVVTIMIRNGIIDNINKAELIFKTWFNIKKPSRSKKRGSNWT